jgi:hypothetical protein
MKITPAQIALLLITAILLGFLGSFAASHWMTPRHAPAGMHDFVHHELSLSDEQEALLEELESAFAIERRRLESDLKAENAALAAAMEEEHEYGPKVGEAIDEVHARMGDLQKATVRHVFNMRDLLNEDQRRAFDRQVSTALTSDPNE